MSDTTPRIYADANIVIELGKLARSIHDASREADLWVFEQMLKASQAGDIALYTSTLSIAECIHIDGVYDKEVQDFFTGILTSGRMFKLVQDSIFVAERARNLRWDHHLKVRGKDAIHVASALEAECKELLSWDTDMSKPEEAAKIELLAGLGVKVITPKQSTLLPSFYREVQENLPLRPATSKPN